MLKIYKICFVICLFLTLVGCNNKNNEPTSEENTKQLSAKELLNQLDCSEINNYPAFFSYAVDNLKSEFIAKAVKPLTESEKELLFKPEMVPGQVYDSAFQVFSVNKIHYSTSTLVIYLVKEIEGSSHEIDQLILVIYDQEGKPSDFFINNLQDNFSTREVNFTSSTAFEVVDTDDEYSVDPETEAEDIANGKIHEPSVMTSYYQIENLKFKRLD